MKAAAAHLMDLHWRNDLAGAVHHAEGLMQFFDHAMQEQRNAVARFLDAREMKEEALEIATDPDYRFDLAVSLGKLGVALELAEQSGSELKWRQLGELALSAGKLQVHTASSLPQYL